MLSIRHVNKSLFKYLGGESFLIENQNKILLPYNVKTLDSDFEFVKKVIGLREDLCLSKDDSVAHKTPEWMNKNMSQQGRENLEEWYKEDHIVIRALERIRKNKGLANV